MTQIAKVAVAAATYAIDKPYDYLVPSGMELSVGCRVTVPFGRGNRTAEGMVLQLRQEVPAKPLKAIENFFHCRAHIGILKCPVLSSECD